MSTTPPQDPGQQPGSPGPLQPQSPPPQSQPPQYGAGQYGAGQPGQPQYGAPQGQPPQSSGPSGPETLDAKGFFAALFDWRFHTLITPKIVSIVYLVGMILIGLMWLVALVQGFSLDPLAGVFVLLVGPVMAVVYLAFWRMTLELYFAIVRMSDDIHRGGGAPRR